MLPAAVDAGVPVCIERQFVKGVVTGRSIVCGDGSFDCMFSSLSAKQSLPSANSHGQRARWNMCFLFRLVDRRKRLAPARRQSRVGSILRVPARQTWVACAGGR